ILSSTHPPPTQIYTLSLHDALPISRAAGRRGGSDHQPGARESRALAHARASHRRAVVRPAHGEAVVQRQARFLAPGLRLREIERSEEHTSELQSPYDLVCRLLLEKK